MSMPNGMKLEQAYEAQRTLLTTRKTERRGGVMNESFTYNERSELTGAQRGSDRFAYAYDNIGNRKSAEEEAESITYRANELNQYTQINTNGSDFRPEYDAEGNQTLIKTATGIWHVSYNAQNRAEHIRNHESGISIRCYYDYMGRRFEKRVEQNGQDILHQRYLYRGYRQLAALDMTRTNQSPLWHLTWDPTQPEATRPLAIRTAGTWYLYGWDLTKNITELYTPAGQLDTDYVYTPYGAVRAAGNITQPIQWSSEYHDTETALVYYNYRYYNPTDGRWTRRDPIGLVGGMNAYIFCRNGCCRIVDIIGLLPSDRPRICTKDYNTPPQKDCYGQEKCRYECKCPEGYEWRDLGTPSMEIWFPCSMPDVMESGSCQRKKRIRRIAPVFVTVPEYSPSMEFRVSLSPQSGANTATIAATIITLLFLIIFRVPA